MIKLDKYREGFKEEYWEKVNRKIRCDVQEQIVEASKQVLPKNFYIGTENLFKQLILSPFSKLKSAYKYMDEPKRVSMKEPGGEQVREPFKTLHDAYDTVIKSEIENIKLNVRMVKELGLTVCPYCNRNYINCRGETYSGAQLDHFYCRKIYPIFSVCLYNLVPVCGTCNHVKGASTGLASPFDEDIDWEKAIVFSYDPKSEKRGKVVVETPKEVKTEIKNKEVLKLSDAYEIHDKDICELLDKKEAYSASQMKELKEVLGEKNITDLEIKQIIFGPEITFEAMKTKPLGKMMHDLHKELKIYD